MELRVLGPVEAWHDGELLDLGPRQQRFILAVLALDAGHVVGVERLTDLLWPTRPPRTARAAIQVRISRLRAILGQHAPLVGGTTGYQLQIDADQVDALRFDRLIQRARDVGPRRRATLLRAALDLWRGSALSGTTSEPAVRDRLCGRWEEARLVAYEDCLDAELQLGRDTRVLEELADLTRSYPGRERLTDLFMLALHRSGQSTRALEVARSHRDYLADELGIAPSARLQELELAILRDDPELHERDTATVDTNDAVEEEYAGVETPAHTALTNVGSSSDGTAGDETGTPDTTVVAGTHTGEQTGAVDHTGHPTDRPTDRPLDRLVDRQGTGTEQPIVSSRPQAHTPPLLLAQPHGRPQLVTPSPLAERFGTAVRATDHPPVPAQLPATGATFVGRDAHLTRLDALLPKPTDTRSTTSSSPPAKQGAEDLPHAPFIAITGTAGVGKTSLAVRWSRRVAASFPDGQLLVRLRGHADEPALTPLDALAIMLRSLGVDPGSVPTRLPDAVALYQTTVARRRLLVVLDNAVDADQVRPLLAKHPGVVTIVTSRDRLAGLVSEQDTQIELEPLAPTEAERLLLETLPTDRHASEPDGVQALTDLCAGLPLALRIAAAQLADEPDLPLRQYVADLAGGRTDLTIDGDPNASVRAAFDLSYEALGDTEQYAFRLFGLIPGVDWTLPAAMALLNTTADATRQALRRLVAVNLVSEHAPGRFQFHDLLRGYAGQRLAAETLGAEQDAAYERLLAWYYSNAVRASRLITPLLRPAPPAPTLPPGLPPTTITDLSSALAWMDAERANLIAAITRCEHNGQHGWAVRLAAIQRYHLNWRGYAGDDRMVREVGVRCANTIGDPALQADAYRGLAHRHGREDPTHGPQTLLVALEHAECTGDDAVIAEVLADLGIAYNRIGDPRRAVSVLLRALRTHPEPAPTEFRAGVLHTLGLSCVTLGQYARAEEYLREAAGLRRSPDSRLARAYTLRALASVVLRTGRPDQALELLEEAKRHSEHYGDTVLEVFLEIDRSLLHSIGGLPDRGLAEADSAVARTTTLGHNWMLPDAHDVRGLALARLGQSESAAAAYQRGLLLAREQGNIEAQVSLLLALAELDVRRDGGDLMHAQQLAEEALSAADASGYLDRVGHAYTVLAEIAHRFGVPTQARRRAERGLEVHRETGDQLGQVRALTLLAELIEAAPDNGEGTAVAATSTAAAYRAEADALASTYTTLG